MSRRKILLVDDSPAMLTTERFILGGGPYDFLTATNGEDAVASAIEHRPDLILLDVIMPRMGGIEACRMIRSDARTRSIPIILITTPGEASNVTTSSNGFNDYVTKPINTIELLSKVRRLLETPDDEK